MVKVIFKDREKKVKRGPRGKKRRGILGRLRHSDKLNASLVDIRRDRLQSGRRPPPRRKRQRDEDVINALKMRRLY